MRKFKFSEDDPAPPDPHSRKIGCPHCAETRAENEHLRKLLKEALDGWARELSGYDERFVYCNDTERVAEIRKEAGIEP